MIKKAKAIILVFLNELLKEIRMSYMKEKRFIGRYIDVEIERRKWAKDTGVILLGERRIETGIRKVHEQIVSYANDNTITRWLGFKKNQIHYTLAGWYQDGSPPKIGGITLEGEKIK